MTGDWCSPSGPAVHLRRHRPLTTVGQMIQAHLDGDTRPSTRAVYDHYAGAVDYNHTNLWRGERPFYDGPRFAAGTAEEQLQRTLKGEYVDSHVWLFTPDTFLRQLRELRLSGRSDWFVDAIVPTPRDEIEFRVRLRRIPRGTDATVEDHPGEVVAEGERPEWVEQQASWHRVDTLQDRIATLETLLKLSESDQKAAERRAAILEAKVDKRDERLAKLRKQLERSEKRVARLREAQEVPAPAAEPGSLGRPRPQGGPSRSLTPRLSEVDFDHLSISGAVIRTRSASAGEYASPVVKRCLMISRWTFDIARNVT